MSHTHAYIQEHVDTLLRPRLKEALYVAQLALYGEVRGTNVDLAEFAALRCSEALGGWEPEGEWRAGVEDKLQLESCLSRDRQTLTMLRPVVNPIQPHSQQQCVGQQIILNGPYSGMRDIRVVGRGCESPKITTGFLRPLGVVGMIGFRQFLDEMRVVYQSGEYLTDSVPAN